jgi:putative ABC transport system permease protein
MARLLLFYRLMVRPLFGEPVRTALTILSVALGVAVVLAIDLASNAAAGSFRSSMETLSGDSNLEVTASGGIPENLVGTLASLPYTLRISPRMEDFAVLTSTKQTLPLVGLDFVAEANSLGASLAGSPLSSISAASQPPPSDPFAILRDPASIWVGSSLHHQPGDHVSLLINDQVRDYTIRGVYSDANGGESAILMDIAAAQRALSRFGRIDRVLIKTPSAPDLGEWQRLIRSALPPGIDVRPQGSGTNENRQMLAAFRWNLRLLSYISLVVGAFLIYNTISVSIVRRRPEIGIVRALGASRATVLAAFLGEAATFGLAGAAIGVPLGRLMAIGAVKLMAATVQSLYVTSRPGAIGLNSTSILVGFLIGVGVSIASAYSPAREASLVSPVQAMARARREYEVRVHKSRDLFAAFLLALAAALASQAPAVAGKPFFGYLAALLLIVASALAIPALVAIVVRVSSSLLGRRFGPEALLASRSLGAALRRTSVLVAALSTAIAMTVSVGIMVGSFRETVVSWMNHQLPADFYIRPAGDAAADRHPVISLDVAEAIARLPGVDAVDRLRAYEISYNGRPVMLGAADLSAHRAHRASNFFSGRPVSTVLADLRDANNVIVSEPFTYKHHASTGDTITLSLGQSRASFRIIDVYYDYSTERGEILLDRNVLLRYLPDPAPSNLAVYVVPGTNPETVRAAIQRIPGDHRLFIFSDREIRTEAVRIFDRTFAITYALEAVAVLVAVMGIAGALLALVIDRRRELGLLRFFGATAGQIRKLILFEAGLLGFLANLAGAILGYFLSLILIFVINKQSFGWTIRFHWPVATLLAALTFVYVATVLAGLYPARIAIRLNPLEVVHED